MNMKPSNIALGLYSITIERTKHISNSIEEKDISKRENMENLKK